jgi:predicted transcriptional regulator
VKDESEDTKHDVASSSLRAKSSRALRAKRPLEENEESARETEEEVEEKYFSETKAAPVQKKRRLYVDREKVQYARELIENQLSNKEMAMLLEMTIACVRKLKLKILNGTVDELIDDSEEHYTKVTKAKSTDACFHDDCKNCVTFIFSKFLRISFVF